MAIHWIVLLLTIGFGVCLYVYLNMKLNGRLDEISEWFKRRLKK